MKKRNIAILLYFISIHLFAKTNRFYSEKEIDQTLGMGFTLTPIVSGNYGASINGNYHLRVSASSGGYVNDFDEFYKLKNTIGYRFGLGVGFQGRKFGLEIPVTYNVERFKAPAIGSEKMKITSLEIGENNYFKFLKEKHYIVFGPYFALNLMDASGGGPDNFNSLGLNLGYGYNITKRLNISLRYKFNLNSIGSKNDGTIEVYKSEGLDINGDHIIERHQRNNSLQLTVRFDIINTRREKDKNRATKPTITTTSPSSAPIVIPRNEPKVVIDYTKLSDIELSEALTIATNKGDSGVVSSIQNEQSIRKAKDPFANFTNAELQEKLNKAIAVEDFAEAENLKLELQKRKALAPAPTGLDANTLEELKAMLAEAVGKEDYDAAQKIQEAINKKNK